MERVLFLMFLILACKSGEKDPYLERLEGMIAYLDKEHQLSTSDCMTVFLLQSDKCNVCTLDNLKEMEADSSDMGQLVFLLSGMNDSIYHYVDSSFHDKKILVDKNQALGKYGLSFMRNVKINICDKAVESYGFY